MLAELKFVQGAVAKKNFIPALTHFRIENGYVRSFNGTLALCSKINLDIDCIPKAAPFIKAIQNCQETVSMSMTPAGRLHIKSGRFKAFIDCVDEETPHVIPEGEFFDINGESLLEAFKTLTTFIGADASRPWSNGVLLKGHSAFATNNVALIEYWVGSSFPIVCNIPKDAVNEMLRIGEAPLQAQVTDTSISFHYKSGSWLRTALLNIKWPDLEKVLNAKSNQQPINEQIYEGLEFLKPFVDKLDRVYITDGIMSTSIAEGEGASYELPKLDFQGVYQLRILNLLKGIAQSIDFNSYPAPCIFYGERVRGAIIGMRT